MPPSFQCCPFKHHGDETACPCAMDAWPTPTPFAPQQPYLAGHLVPGPLGILLVLIPGLVGHARHGLCRCIGSGPIVLVGRLAAWPLPLPQAGEFSGQVGHGQGADLGLRQLVLQIHPSSSCRFLVWDECDQEASRATRCAAACPSNRWRHLRLIRTKNSNRMPARPPACPPG